MRQQALRVGRSFRFRCQQQHGCSPRVSAYSAGYAAVARSERSSNFIKTRRWRVFLCSAPAKTGATSIHALVVAIEAVAPGIEVTIELPGPGVTPAKIPTTIKVIVMPPLRSASDSFGGIRFRSSREPYSVRTISELMVSSPRVISPLPVIRPSSHSRSMVPLGTARGPEIDRSLSPSRALCVAIHLSSRFISDPALRYQVKPEQSFRRT